MAVFIEFKDVFCLGEDGRAVFEGLDCGFSGGEKVLVCAPPGSGKSLLLKLITCTVRPQGGNIRLFGRDTARLSVEELNGIRKRIGVVSHHSVLISNLKVIENIALPILYHTDLAFGPAMERALKLLKSSGYAGDVWELPGNLHMYARKEVEAARALALAPDIVLCESPMDGLTDSEKKNLSELLTGYHGGSRKRLMVFTAVDESDSGLLAPDRILRIERRRIVERYRAERPEVQTPRT